MVQESYLTKLNRAVALASRDHGDSTIDLIVEETAELQKELMKMQRGIGEPENVIEEACDVLVVVFRLLMENDISRGEVEERMANKLRRALNRLEPNNIPDIEFA